MPNKDWYWDRFDVDVIPMFFGNDDILNLSDEQTSALAEQDVEGRIDYTDKQRNQYETRFIDELYGTDERAWTGEDGPRDDGTWGGRGEIGSMGSGRGGKGGNWENPEHVTWGLDLVRDWTGKEDLKFGTTEHYEWQTRGTVDWAHYYDDNAYQKAYREWDDKENRHGTLEQFLTADQGKFRTTDQRRVDFINWANTEYQAKEDDHGKEALRDTWDNQYVDQFDPETAKPYVATYLDVPDLWSAAASKSDWETPDTPIEVVRPPNLPTLDTIKRTQVQQPDSIKHFGEAKSAPTTRYTAGGQPE